MAAAGRKTRTAKASSSKSDSSSPSETNSDPRPPPSASFSWLDLPDHLWENISERLAIIEYVRFGAVCPQWRSIQSRHRRRYAPSPPPMVNRPWFIPLLPEQESVPCSDPFASEKEERERLLRIPLSKCYLEHRRINNDMQMFCFMSLRNGWLLMDDRPISEHTFPQGHQLTLLNPLTGNQIMLPRLGNLDWPEFKAAASHPPDMAVLLATDERFRTVLWLFRTNENHWRSLDCKEVHQVHPTKIELAFSQGKFYCRQTCSRLIVVDPRPEEPKVYSLDMDVSALPEPCDPQDYLNDPLVVPCWGNLLVESDGQLLMVMKQYYRQSSTKAVSQRFQVFAADFDRRRWAKVESLGDHALLVYGETFVMPILAADVGAKKNCIYHLDPSYGDPSLLVEFDMDGGGEVTGAPLRVFPCNTHLMFVPSLF